LSIVDDETAATPGPLGPDPPAAAPGTGSSSEPRALPTPRKALEELPADSFPCRPLPPLFRQPHSVYVAH
jgi:hypothetical protein